MATDVAKREDVECLGKNLIDFIMPNEFYSDIEKRLKDEDHDNSLAISLGFNADNYYTPKEKMIMQNDLDSNLFVSRSPMRKVATIL